MQLHEVHLVGPAIPADMSVTPLSSARGQQPSPSVSRNNDASLLESELESEDETETL